MRVLQVLMLIYNRQCRQMCWWIFSLAPQGWIASAEKTWWVSIVYFLSSAIQQVTLDDDYDGYHQKQFRFNQTQSLFTLINLLVFLLLLILVVAQVAQEQQQLELVLSVVDHRTCIPHVIPSAHRAVFSWWDRIFALARKSVAETLASYD